jgi:hypothetical protein
MRVLVRIPSLVLAITVLAVLRQALIALDVLSMGTNQDRAGQLWFVFTAAILGLFACGGVLIVVALAMPRTSARIAGSRPVWLLALAGGLLSIVDQFTYDPYYLPTLRRISDGRSTGGLVAALVIGSVVVALVGRFGGRVGLLVVGFAAWFVLLTMWVGH